MSSVDIGIVAPHFEHEGIYFVAFLSPPPSGHTIHDDNDAKYCNLVTDEISAIYFEPGTRFSRCRFIKVRVKQHFSLEILDTFKQFSCNPNEMCRISQFILAAQFWPLDIYQWTLFN